jgi:hypothetical protein
LRTLCPLANARVTKRPPRIGVFCDYFVAVKLAFSLPLMVFGSFPPLSWFGTASAITLAWPRIVRGPDKRRIANMSTATSFTQKLLASVTALAASFVLITAAAGPISLVA